MQKVLTIHPLKHSKIDSYNRMGFNLEYNGKKLRHIWIDYPENFQLPNVNNSNSYLLLTIFDAMKAGLDVEVKGQVDKKLLSNLQVFNSLWAMWYPSLYKKIQIFPEETTLNVQKFNGSCIAFSGGLDATFSALNFYQNKADFEKLNFGIFIHGLDIPIRNHDEFQNALSKAYKILKLFNVPLIPLRTNFKIQSSVNYEHSHAAAIIGVMSNLKSYGNQLIIAASDWYDRLEIPWGSTPVSDYLLGGSEYSVIHDGAEFTRTQKLAALRNWPDALNKLRVCWQGSDKSKNCMECEKCFRTFMHFLANKMKPTSNLEFKGDISKKLLH